MQSSRIPSGRNELTSDQRTFLLYGPDDRCGDAFDTEAEVIAAWELHREQLLASYAGRRPWAWRAIDRPEVAWKNYDCERSLLWRAGVLAPEEKAKLEASWREDFERAQGPNFWHCLGPDRYLKGEEARRAFYNWADIPRELVKKWTAERRRSQKEEPLSETTEGLQSA